MSGNPTAAAAAGQRGHPHYTRHAVTSAIAQSSSSSAVADQQGGDDRKSSDGEDGEDDAADAEAGSGASPAGIVQMMRDMARELKEMKKQQKQQQQQQQQQQQPLSLHASSSSPPVTDLAALVRAMQDGQARQAEQMLKQQAATAAQQLVLRSLGELPTFSGKGGDTTLIAHEWLQRAERFFTIREKALGIDAALGDEARLLNAAYALADDARRWYDALPQQPSTWAGFRDAVKARFCSVPSERIRVDKLREFVEKAAKMRDKLNVVGMQAFTTRFAQLAGEVSDRFLTDHGQLELLARGLPQRYAEVVAKEDAKEPPPPLHEVINLVLARASQKEHAASYGGAFASPASAAPINLDPISLAATTFGLTREVAESYFSDCEGWAPHDTQSPQGGSSSSSGAAPATSPTPTSSLDEKFDKLLAAFAAQGKRVGAGPDARDRGASRRNPPSGVLKEVPHELSEARKKAGLCIKCGVAKYEPGGGGHNSRTCKAAADKTTSAAEGVKKANF